MPYAELIKLSSDVNGIRSYFLFLMMKLKTRQAMVKMIPAVAKVE